MRVRVRVRVRGGISTQWFKGGGVRPDAMLDPVEPPLVGARIQARLRVRQAGVRWAGGRWWAGGR